MWRRRCDCSYCSTRPAYLDKNSQEHMGEHTAPVYSETSILHQYTQKQAYCTGILGNKHTAPVYSETSILHQYTRKQAYCTSILGNKHTA